MATQYSTILKLALPTQGELSGTWGDVVNNNITSMVEEAIAGRAVINTWSTNSHTLTTANGTTSESRCAMLEFTDTGTALSGAGTVICPTASKIYICKNDAGQTVTIKTSAGTGVAIADGETKFVFCDGTNVVEAVTSIETLSTADLTATTADINGGTIDGTVIGGSSAAAGSFTTITASGEITANGGVAFGDNDKATFGAGSDLQIYHDGLNSYMGDFGTGDLYLRASTNLYIGNSAGSASFITATDGGAVDLRYNGSTKLATTATGIDVTGTVTADGLTVDGGSSEIKFSETASSNASLVLQDATERLSKIQLDITSPNVSTDYYAQGKSSGWYGRHRFYTSANNTTAVNRMEIGSNGDISFYEDTGVSQSFFWDASAESLGIGTTSPAGQLELERASNANYSGTFAFEGGSIQISDNSNITTYPNSSAQLHFKIGSSGVAEAYIGGYRESSNASSLIFGTQSGATRAERMRITSSGNVGIGTTSPFYKLVVSAGGASGIEFGPAYSGTANLVQHYSRSGSVYVDAVNDAAQHRFNISGSEKARIDSSGNLLVGTTDGTPYASNVKGAAFYNSGAISGSVDGLPAMYLNRKTSDGTIADFRKDGTTVGSIGNLATSMYISGSTSQAGLLFNGTSYEPTTNGSTRVDNSITIGSGSYRYKNLYLSGGVYLGGTGAANHLDDYEEGTWTPSLGGTTTYTVQSGRYTKVGNKVFFECRILVNAIGTGSNTTVSGLPFTSAADPRGTANLGYFGNAASSITHGAGLVASSDTAFILYTAGGATTTLSAASFFTSGTDVYLSGSYTAA